MSLYVDIEKKYKDFSLKIKLETAGDVLGILGASGCGKSMTLKCIAGIKTPDRGKIVLNGRVLFDSEKKINLKPQKRNVGYLFQDYALFPSKTVKENILCAAKGEKEKVLEKWVSLFRLQGLEEKYPHQLSGGQKQRTALARMLVSQPEVLLLDEPFSSLDSHLKEQLQVEMWSLLQSTKKDILLVTHSRDEAYRLCPKLLVMEQGRNLCMGDTGKIFQEPVYLEAAKLTGCKNFTRVKRISEKILQAVDWGICLSTDRSIPEDITHAGVRAHYFCPAQKEEENAFKVHLLEVIESPFEMYVVLRAEGEKANMPVWWKVSKEKWFQKYQEQVPEYFKVEPEKIMLLKTTERGKKWNE